ncbi:beta/alpha barrel domain-containing protein [Rosistilla ulvae]|uniref:hypothetical protein n=1 Tax=Rosistilla ulvae TaxID=1930277 RepID=UPI001C54D397|nr:hypothetical protein [Rosistilla ulvae]
MKISASNRAVDFTRLGEQGAVAEPAAVDRIPIDAIVSHFVPNLSIGLPVVRGISNRCR